MKKKVLIITVGSSDEPVVQAIKFYKPDFIYFICSGGKPETASERTVDGEGKVCIRKREKKCPKCKEVIEKEEAYPNILNQSEYQGEYKKVILDDPDNFEEVYAKTKGVLEEAKKEDAEIICDFTGGTKTMSAVLTILSAFNFETKPSLSKGERVNITKIEGDSVPVIENINISRIDFMMRIVDSLIEKYLYFPACHILSQLLTCGFEGEFQKKILKKYNLCNAFYLWDNFEYEKAFKILKNYAEEYKQQFEYLLCLTGKKKSSGYEPVFDLIENANRQAINGFYDNAVARIYRCIELFAQIRLKTKYDINTSNLELNKVKNKEKWEKKKNEKGEIKIGLIEDYELLLELEDEVGKVYKDKKGKLMEKLEVRNFSKLAHGDKPVTEDKWKEFYGFVTEFIENCCEKLKIKISYPKLPSRIEV